LLPVVELPQLGRIKKNMEPGILRPMKFFKPENRAWKAEPFEILLVYWET